MKVYNPKILSTSKATVTVTHNPKVTYDFLKPDINNKQVIHNPHCSFNHGKHLSVAAENAKKKVLVSETKKENLKELISKDFLSDLKKENLRESELQIEDEILSVKNINLDDSPKINVILNQSKFESYNVHLDEQVEYINPESLYWTPSFIDL